MLLLHPQPFLLLLFPSNLSPSKTLHKGLKYQQGFRKRKRVMKGSLGQKRRQRRSRRRKRRRRQRIKPMPISPMTALQLKTWYLRLKLLNPRRILINHRLKYRVLALFCDFFNGLILFDATLIFII